ncbi:mucin-7-like [Papaver somniferum]|uniref:mucin-7-like n=1 Tax=Papaver somniferum TaxID=3469 RepID=UPI000E705606|nr:mucin-7-like [Papaver somniferum]
MVELRSRSATSPENTSAEPVPGTNTPSGNINTPPTNSSSTESAPSDVAPPITRARAAAAPNVFTQPTNPSSTESAPSSVTPPVTKAKAAATDPNVSSKRKLLRDVSGALGLSSISPRIWKLQSKIAVTRRPKFQIGDMVVKATSFQVGNIMVKIAIRTDSPEEREDEPYLVADVLLGGYWKLINTEKLEGVTVHFG